MVCVLLLLCFACAQPVPLKVTSISPGNPETSSTTLRNRDAITVVFSRSVIALGSDFGMAAPALFDALPTAAAAAENVPFYFTASGAEKPVPGKFRWVSTYIARFDPDVNWPLDLSFELRMNPALEAWDGTRVTVDERHSKRKYRTDHLTGGGGWSQITSEQALRLTNHRWSSSVKITLLFFLLILLLIYTAVSGVR